jgi:hypothetical protein
LCSVQSNSTSYAALRPKNPNQSGYFAIRKYTRVH